MAKQDRTAAAFLALAKPGAARDECGMSTALYRGMDATTLVREYDARASVPSFEAEAAAYARLSAEALARWERRADIVYDPQSGETLDVYPAAPGAPVFLWIHGGYWRALSKDDNAFVASGLIPHGVAVVNVNYTLAPAASLDEITRQVRAAVAWTVRNGGLYGIDTRHVHVGGSSAGGHLAGTLLTAGCLHGLGLPSDAIGTALLLSGLFDLEPLLHTPQNEWLKLDPAAARRNSPLLHLERNSPARVIAACGGQETAEFKRQTAAMLVGWAQAGNAGRRVDMPDHNHFNIAGTLAEPDSALIAALLSAVGSAK